MLCEVIAYILSRQRLSAKTFVTGCVFYALQDRLSLWVLCDTSGVGKLSASPSHGFALRASPAVTHGVSPSGDSGCGLGGFSFLSLSTSPRVRPSGITRGYAWCVPSGDSEWTMSYFFSYQEKQTLGRNVFSHSCGLICRAQNGNV